MDNFKFLIFMSKQSDQVIAGYIQLSPTDRTAVVEAINKYNRGVERERKELEESIAKRGVDLGPIDSGKCVCCGR